MKFQKIIPAVLAAILLLSACGSDKVDDHNWEPPVTTAPTLPTEEPTAAPDPTDPLPTEPIPTEPAPTEPAPTDPLPTEPTEPEVEFNPEEEEHIHRYGKWTTIQAATCTRLGRKSRTCICGEVETKSYIEEHKYSSWTVKKPASCTETGVNARYCSICKTENTTITAALGHNKQITPGIPATCTEPGIKDKIVCKRCDVILQEADVIEAGHDVEITEFAIAPSCGVEGRTQGSYCTMCLEVLEVSEVLPALTHLPENQFAEDPTCTTYGLTEWDICIYCNTILTSPEVLDRLGHTLADGVCTDCGHTCDHGIDPENPGQPGSNEETIGDPVEIEGTDYVCQRVVCQLCGEESQIVFIVAAPAEDISEENQAA